MIDTYRGGYKKALYDIHELMNNDYKDMDMFIKSKKQYKTMLSSLIMYLLQNPNSLDDFMDGQAIFHMNKNCEIVGITRR